MLPAEAMFDVGEGSVNEFGEIVFGESLEGEHPGTGQQRRVHLEIGIFGGCANKGDRAVLNVREQGILLGLVEPMDLVDEENGLTTVEVTTLASGLDDLSKGSK
jgi:hypothetical protein